MRRRRRKSKESSEATPAESPETAETVSAYQSEDDLEQMEAPAAPRRLVLRRRLLPFVINWPAMLMIAALVVLTVFALLLNQGALPTEIVTWWPVAVAIPAALWFVVALVRRDARSLLGSTALLGLSLSMLLAAQKVAPLGTTLVVLTFIATRTPILPRAF